jgi:hypothetical protein
VQQTSPKTIGVTSPAARLTIASSRRAALVDDRAYVAAGGRFVVQFVEEPVGSWARQQSAGDAAGLTAE